MREPDYSSGSTNITDAVFQKMTVQMMVYDECSVRINTDTMFHKHDVLGHLGIIELAGNIMWEQIIKRLRMGLATFQRKVNYQKERPVIELYPVTETFFRIDAEAKKAMLDGVATSGRTWDDSFPGHYIAGGYGKKTAGWVVASHANGRFARYRTREVMVPMRDGVERRISEQAETVLRKLIAEGGDPQAIRELCKIAGIPVPPELDKK